MTPKTKHNHYVVLTIPLSYGSVSTKLNKNLFRQNTAISINDSSAYSKSIEKHSAFRAEETEYTKLFE